MTSQIFNASPFMIVALAITGVVAGAISDYFLATRRCETASSVFSRPSVLRGIASVVGYLIAGYIFAVVGYFIVIACLSA